VSGKVVLGAQRAMSLKVDRGVKVRDEHAVDRVREIGEHLQELVRTSERVAMRLHYESVRLAVLVGVIPKRSGVV
jgi:hypothetical protein